MQITGLFVILIQKIAEPRYDVYFHKGSIHLIPTGVCYGEITPLQLSVWGKDMIILVLIVFIIPGACWL